MRFVLLFLMILALDLFLGWTIYSNYPQYRSQLLEEGQAVENLSAILALGAAGVALFCWRRSTGARRKIALLLAIGSLLLCFEESTYGLTAFGDAIPWRQIRLDNVKVNTLHDFLFLAYREIKRHSPFRDAAILYTAVTVTLLVPIAMIARYVRRLPAEFVPPFLLVTCCVTLGGASLTLDLDLIRYEPVFLFEELFEMNGALALLFAGLALLFPSHATQPRAHAAGIVTAETAIEPRLPLPGLAADADRAGMDG